MRVLALLMLAVATTPLVAQGGPVGGWLEDYARLLQLSGQLPLSQVTARPLTSAAMDLSGAQQAHPWSAVVAARVPTDLGSGRVSLSVGPVETRAYVNGARPWGINDGAAWQGRGLTLAAAASVRAALGPVSLTVAPLVTRSANTDFALSPLAVPAGTSLYTYPVIRGGTLDAPQRFGPDAFTRVDWGNTNIRAEAGPVAFGLSHESLWWGPGMRNDVVMTNNGPGFWHAHLSTARPLPIGIGRLSGRWIWGSLRESTYFDTSATNDRRYMTGIVLSLVPRGAPGLELGAARTFQQEWDSPGFEEFLWVFRPLQKTEQATPGNPNGEDGQDQMASLWLRWALPSSGLEIYGEWAKGDHSSNFRDLLVEPEHGSGWLFGLQKVVSHDAERTWRFATEATILGAPRTTAVRSGGAGFFYVHTLIPQGWTHRGQVLGAGIGPGSSQISFTLDRFATWGKVGGSLFRTVYDNDRYYRRPNVGTIGDFYSHEVEPSFSLDATIFRGAWDLNGAVTASRLLNKHYIYSNDEWNVNLVVGARYHPTLRR